MSPDDYYTILGVSQDASTRQIKAAYRRLAFQHHPDRNRDTPGSSELMKRINEAYAVISSPVKRREYDELRRQFGSAAYSRYQSSHSQQDIYNGSDINTVFEEMARAFGFRGFEHIFREFYGPDSQHFEFKRPRIWVRTFTFGRPFSMDTGHPSTPHRDGPLGRIARLAFRKMSGFDLPENGGNIRDHIYIDSGTGGRRGAIRVFPPRALQEAGGEDPRRREGGAEHPACRTGPRGQSWRHTRRLALRSSPAQADPGQNQGLGCTNARTMTSQESQDLLCAFPP